MKSGRASTSHGRPSCLISRFFGRFSSASPWPSRSWAGPGEQETALPPVSGTGAAGRCRGDALRRPQRSSLAATRRGRHGPVQARSFPAVRLRSDRHSQAPRRGAQGSVLVGVYPQRAPQARPTVTEQIDLVHRMVARYADAFELALCADDIDRIDRAGKIASLIGIEGGMAIENSLAQLRIFYTLDARYMTLTHNTTLDWADAANDAPKHDGLTPFGERVVKEMNRLGMLVDISHVSPGHHGRRLARFTCTVIASHSSAFAICPSAPQCPRRHPQGSEKERRRGDGQFLLGVCCPESGKKMRGHGGDARQVSRPNARAKALDDGSNRKARTGTRNYRDVADHIDHIVKVAGIDHVGIGSDFDGITMWPVGLEDVSCYPG